MQEVAHLSSLLNSYNSLNNLYVSVTDLSGILSHPLLNVPLRDRIHAKPFCDIAKSTSKGFRTCKRCRYFADRKAIATQKLFHGYCAFGLYEIGLPIVDDGKTLGVVYVGNLAPDLEFASNKANRTCLRTQVDYNRLCSEFQNAQTVQDLSSYIHIAETVCSYIKMVLKSYPWDLNRNSHWLIDEMKLYARQNFRNSVKLQDLAGLYSFNEKYIGRLFKKATDVSFTQYINKLRLSAAANELLSSEKSIINIALDCGFENVTYFNRLFKTRFGISPKEYRRQRPMHS